MKLHNKDDTIKNFSLLDIIPISLGTNVKNNSTNPDIKKEGDIMDIIIKRGTHIPITNYQTYSTAHENQDSMSINIYEGIRILCQLIFMKVKKNLLNIITY